MKTAIISFLLSIILLSAFGCARGGNVDKGNDGDIGEDSSDIYDNSNGVISDDIDDILPDATDDRDGTDDLGRRIRRDINDLNTMEPDDLIPGARDDGRDFIDPTLGAVPMR